MRNDARNPYHRCLPIVLLLSILVGSGGCSIKVFKDFSDPLKEFTLQGKGDEKVLLIPIRGIINTKPDEGILINKPSTVQEIMSHLRKAKEDPKVKAVLLEIESPGGSATASDILFHEIIQYREESGAKVVTLMMNMAASGGYYVALASDRIIAHPMSVTGSVGAIFFRPNAKGLMDKIGVEPRVIKSGKYKDMGSPFRESLPEELEILQSMIEDMSSRFLKLATERRKFTKKQYEDVATARVFTAQQALEKGLIDSIGYMDDAIREAKSIAALPDDSRLVVYRRTRYPDDNPYNPVTMITLPYSRLFELPETGFYYLWLPQDLE